MQSRCFHLTCAGKVYRHTNAITTYQTELVLSLQATRHSGISHREDPGQFQMANASTLLPKAQSPQTLIQSIEDAREMGRSIPDPPTLSRWSLPEEKLLETVLQCFAHPLVCVNYCKVLLPLQELSAMVLLLQGHNSLFPLQLFSSTLCLVAVCVHACDVFIRYADATESAAGMWHNMQYSRESFFFSFSSLSFKLLNHIITCPMKVLWGKREKCLFGAMATGSSPTTIAIQMMKEKSSELNIKS